MISLPDFKEKQILFVRAEWGKPSHLRFHNDNIVFVQEKKVINRVSMHKAFAVFICGDLSFTTNFIRHAKEHGISIFLLKNNFELYGGLMTTAEGHYVLRTKQYNTSQSVELEMAKLLVENKIKNQSAVLTSRAETHTRDASDDLSTIVCKVRATTTNEELLGLEGNYSREYFGKHFKTMEWRRRAPRTKEDINNLLLDMGYTLLFNFVDSLLRLHGFDTYKGFYHKLFFQRRSLACDIMEPLRPLIDKKILKMHNLRQINNNDFSLINGAYVLDFEYYPKYSGLFLESLMDEKESIFRYVHGFYAHVMDSEKNQFPIYTISV
jgi:CRISP-associated protein Cas1